MKIKLSTLLVFLRKNEKSAEFEDTLTCDFMEKSVKTDFFMKSQVSVFLLSK